MIFFIILFFNIFVLFVLSIVLWNLVICLCFILISRCGHNFVLGFGLRCGLYLTILITSIFVTSCS